jgi:hypothetical protein
VGRDGCGPLRQFFAAQKTLIAALAAIPGAAHYKEVNAAKKGQKPRQSAVNCPPDARQGIETSGRF